MTVASARGKRSRPQGKGRAEGSPSSWLATKEILDQLVAALEGAGLQDPVERLEQIAQLLYLKRLDDQEPATRSRIFTGPMTSRFRWSKLREQRGEELQRLLADRVFYYLASLVNEAPAVADYYQGAVLKVEDPGALARVFGLIDAIDFESLRPDEMGRILEYLIAETTPAGSGEFRTPQHVRALMVKLLDPQVGESIYDPACGTGGFLTDTVIHLLETNEGVQRADLGRWLHGHDISKRMIRIAKMNLDLQGVGPVDVRRANTLTASGAGVTPAEMSRKFDVILSAPAFGSAAPGEPIRPDLPIESTRNEILFVELAMESLAPGGRAAMIVPESLLAGSGSTYVELRRRLISKFQLLAVIALPRVTFRSYSATNTAILVFQRPASGPERTQRVWFCDMQDAQGAGGASDEGTEREIQGILADWQQYRASGFAQPPGVRAGTVHDAAQELRSWWAERGQIEANDCDLSVSRYKPRLAATTSTNAANYLLRALAAQQGIAAPLVALLDRTRQLDRFQEWIRGAPSFPLGELVEMPSGGTPNTKDPALWGGPTCWASAKDMRASLLRGTVDHITEQARQEVFPPPVVLIVVRGMSLASRIPLAVTAVPTAINQDLRALRPRPSTDLDPWYLFAYLRSVEKVLLGATQGTSHGSLSLPSKILHDLPVPMPPRALRDEIGRITRAAVELGEEANRLRDIVDGLVPVVVDQAFEARPHDSGD